MTGTASTSFTRALLLTILLLGSVGTVAAVNAPHHPLSQIYPIDVGLNLSGKPIIDDQGSIMIGDDVDMNQHSLTNASDLTVEDGVVEALVENDVTKEWIISQNSGIAGLDVANSDEIYIGGAQENKTLIKINGSGDIRWQYPSFSWQAGAIAATDNRVYVASGTCCQPQGEYLYHLDDQKTIQWAKDEPAGVGRINDLAVDSNGNVIWAGSSPDVAQYNTTGQQQWSKNFAGRATSIGIDGSDNSYIGTENGIRKYDQSGTFQWADSELDEAVRGIAPHSGGVYALDGSNLTHYTATGDKEWEIEGQFSDVVTDGSTAWAVGDGRLAAFDTEADRLSISYNPFFDGNIAIDEDGHLYVTGNNRIIRLNTSTSKDTFFLANRTGTQIGSTYDTGADGLLNVDGDIAIDGTVDADQFLGTIRISDTRSQNLDPLQRQKEVDFDFKSAGTVGEPLTGGFGTLITLAQWSDASGGAFHQLFFNEVSPFYRRSTTGKETWRPWQRILTSMNDAGIGLNNPAGKLHVRSWDGYTNPVFNGTATNKLEISGDYTDNQERAYRIRVTSSGSPNQFEWSDDGGSTWNGPESMSTSYTTLSHGVTVRWRGNSGETISMYDEGDWWKFNASKNYGDALVVNQGNVGIGTTEPTSALDVEGGDIEVGGNINLSGSTIQGGSVERSLHISVDEMKYDANVTPSTGSIEPYPSAGEGGGQARLPFLEISDQNATIAASFILPQDYKTNTDIRFCGHSSTQFASGTTDIQTTFYLMSGDNVETTSNSDTSSGSQTPPPNTTQITPWNYGNPDQRAFKTCDTINLDPIISEADVNPGELVQIRWDIPDGLDGSADDYDRMFLGGAQIIYTARR